MPDGSATLRGAGSNLSQNQAGGLIEFPRGLGEKSVCCGDFQKESPTHAWRRTLDQMAERGELPFAGQARAPFGRERRPAVEGPNGRDSTAGAWLPVSIRMASFGHASTQNPQTMHLNSSISKRTGNFSIACSSYSPASM